MSFYFYKADAKYCDFLRLKDPCVPYTMDKKNTRPFVGIVFSINGFNYYVPLTSPKPKHLKMKNQVDFLKINNGKWGAINFNNMIPIPIECLKPIEIKIFPSDDKATIDYKNLLANQLSWCNKTKNAELITKKAEKLYTLIVGKTASQQLQERCCKFSVDEKQCLAYSNRLLDSKDIDKLSIRDRIAEAEVRADAHNAGLNKDTPDRNEPGSLDEPT